jgi:hypothetical protein
MIDEVERAATELGLVHNVSFHRVPLLSLQWKISAAELDAIRGALPAKRALRS